MAALQQHLKALASRTAHYAVCATGPGEPSGLLPVTDKTQKNSISSVLQLAHGSTERLLDGKVREATLAELELYPSPEESCAAWPFVPPTGTADRQGPARSQAQIPPSPEGGQSSEGAKERPADGATDLPAFPACCRSSTGKATAGTLIPKTMDWADIYSTLPGPAGGKKPPKLHHVYSPFPQSSKQL